MNDAKRGSRCRFTVPMLCLLLCLAVTGCGSSGSVSGKVSYKGEPLGGGVVVFTSTEGKSSASAQIGPDGQYSIDKIPAGPVKISVETNSAKPAKAPPRGALPTPPAGAMPKDIDPSKYNQASQPKGKYVAIPENYADPEKSGLTYTVTSGPQTHEIDLK
jgi:hypothetical protein